MKKYLLPSLLIITAFIASFVLIKAQEKELSAPSNDCIATQTGEHCTRDYVGLSEQEATEKALGEQLTVKIRSRDGSTDVTNTDLGGTIIYFVIENEVVVEASFT